MFKIPYLCSQCMYEFQCTPSDLHQIPHRQHPRKVGGLKISSFHLQPVDLQYETLSYTTESEYSFYKEANAMYHLTRYSWPLYQLITRLFALVCSKTFLLPHFVIKKIKNLP